MLKKTERQELAMTMIETIRRAVTAEEVKAELLGSGKEKERFCQVKCV